MEELKFNKYQTQLSPELVVQYPKEVIDELFEYINAVPFIQRLISADRKYAKDLPRDAENKIIVDLSNPHILTNMDYFRESAIHFQKYGSYTKLKVNEHPQSEWMRWFKQEVLRCWNGMVRPEDGEWITGDMYFFLNYSIMTQTITKYNSRGHKYGVRTDELPECWEGIYWRFHYLDQARYGGLYNNWEGQVHAAEIASRGKGKSYSLASILERLFTLGIGPGKFSNKRKALIVADLKTYLIDDGTLNKFEEGLIHLQKTTQFPAQKLRESLTNMYWECGWEDSESKTEKGPKNLVLGQAIGDDPDKSRGKRSDWMLGEEFGKFGKFSDWWSTSMPNVQEGEIVFGLGYVVGTGGTEGSDFTGALDMIYSPESNHIYGLPNVYDRGSNGSKKTVFFFPAYVNYKPYYNKDGVSDVIGAMLSELRQRYDLKYNSNDPLKITKRKAEFAFTIQDAIMKRDSTVYPVADLNDRVNQIDGDATALNDMWVGNIELTQGEVKWKPNADLYPILQYPHKDNKLEGSIHIKAMPEKDSNNKVPWGRYIAGCDPYDDDVSNTLSLGSVFILDLWTDDIVAEYTGRPMFADDFYENCRRLLLMYNAECNYENNKKGLFTYFDKHNCLYLLSDTLDFLKDKDMAKISYGNKAHPYSQKVYTPNGIKQWGDIKIGDKLFGSNNKLTTVIDIPFDEETDIYEITLKDGRKVKASDNHLWKVVDWNNKEKILFTKDILNNYYRNKGKYKEYKYYILKQEEVEFKYKSILINPYFLGLSLGDGCFTQTTKNQLYFTSNKEDFDFYNSILKYDYKKLDNRHYRIIYPRIGDYLKIYNLNDKKSHTKFIPDDYKYNSKHIRLNLLKGLLDSDGHVGYGGNPEYVTISERLAYDVLEITRSLGINCNLNINNNKNGKVYKIRFYTDIKLFNLKRKYSKQKLTKTRAFKTAIVDIKYIGIEKAKCVTVNSEDSCYLIGDFIITHNSKGTANYSNSKSGGVSAYGRRCIRDYLLKPYTYTVIEIIDGVETEVDKTIPNLFRIKYRALLQELAMWNSDGNFDRHDALVMLMLLREDKLRLVGDSNFQDRQKNRDINYLGEDAFFQNNYKANPDDKLMKQLEKIGYKFDKPKYSNV